MEKYKVVQYEEPPKSLEWAGYIIAVVIFAAAVLSPGFTLWPVLLASLAMYWNYRLYNVMRIAVSHANSNEISKLLRALAELDTNKTQKGTNSSEDGLSKGDSDEQSTK